MGRRVPLQACNGMDLAFLVSFLLIFMACFIFGMARPSTRVASFRGLSSYNLKKKEYCLTDFFYFGFLTFDNAFLLDELAFWWT